MPLLAAVVIAGLGLFSQPTAGPTTPPVQTPGSNITIAGCHAQLDPPPLRIDYTNVAKSAATEVDFVVFDAAGTIANVDDHGHFAPGQPINHVFKLSPDVSPLGLSTARCIVTKVVYADGTSWINPNPK